MGGGESASPPIFLDGDAMTLIERLEAATAGSRELDAEIAHAIGAFKPKPVTARDENFWTQHYTTSLDAALTLVPDGYDYIIYRIDGEYYAEVGPTGSFGFTKCVGAPTIALAICIAALKARTP